MSVPNSPRIRPGASPLALTKTHTPDFGYP